MGIRFSCHLCNHPLHVKDYQASKRGKCPKCQGAFRVPPKDADFSLAIDESISSIKPANLSKPLSSCESGPLTPPASNPEPSPEANDHPSMPASLLPLIDSRWYVRPPSGGQYGPATTQMLLDWIAEKRVTADALLWREGLDGWLSARELVPESFGGSTALGIHDVPPPSVSKPPPNIARSAAPNLSANVNASQPANQVANNPAGPAVPTANNKVAIALKKKKQVKRQWMILGLLATMALCLATALIVILTRGL